MQRSSQWPFRLLQKRRSFFHWDGSATTGINGTPTVRGQENMLDGQEFPSWVPSIFVESSSPHGVAHCRGGIRLPFCLRRWTLCSESWVEIFELLAVTVGINSFVGSQKLIVDNSLTIPPATEHNLALVELGLWSRNWRLSCFTILSFSLHVIVQNPLFVTSNHSIQKRLCELTGAMHNTYGDPIKQVFFGQIVWYPSAALEKKTKPMNLL